MACKPADLLTTHPFPSPVDTGDRPVVLQEEHSVDFGHVHFDNDFEGARMNAVEQRADGSYLITILPENEPINSSPHYAFRITSPMADTLHIDIDTGSHKHRYWPKVQHGEAPFIKLDTLLSDTIKAGNVLTLILPISKGTTIVAAQELRTTSHNLQWMQALQSAHPFISSGVIGQSKLGRDIHHMELGEGARSDKPAILIFSRTHPPEVPGYLAMQAFVEELLRDSPLSRHFRDKYRILAYPLINPDGVDLGHWRHNAGGIDLNRDWSHFRQEETHAVATHVLKEVRSHDNKVVLGIDFHSTQEDVIYTHTANRISSIHPFKDLWIQALHDDLGVLRPNEEAYDLSSPMTKGWFFLEFGAEALIYEVGDASDREFLKYKAEVAAREMMKLLALYNPEP